MLDVISLWVGRIIIFSLFVLFISFCWYKIVRYLSNGLIEVKAIGYAIGSNLKMVKNNKSLLSQITMKKGRQWYIKYKGKTYLWECVEEENKK